VGERPRFLRAGGRRDPPPRLVGIEDRRLRRPTPSPPNDSRTWAAAAPSTTCGSRWRRKARILTWNLSPPLTRAVVFEVPLSLPEVRMLSGLLRITSRLAVAALLCFVVESVPVAAQESPDLRGPADLVLLGGRVIFTLDADERVTQAIAVRGQRIVAVGSDAEIQRFTGRKTRVIPLEGHAVVPGFEYQLQRRSSRTAGFRRRGPRLLPSPTASEARGRALESRPGPTGPAPLHHRRERRRRSSVPSRKSCCIRAPMHPGSLRCTSVAYSSIPPSARLAIRAPRRSRC
jgi:hypothetical protein